MAEHSGSDVIRSGRTQPQNRNIQHRKRGRQQATENIDLVRLSVAEPKRVLCVCSEK